LLFTENICDAIQSKASTKSIVIIYLEKLEQLFLF